jgi:hypothetical protein
MVAIAVLLLLHVPPGVVLVNVVLVPTHTLPSVGDIPAGVVLTVMALVTKQPVAVMVYVIVAIPVVTPFTTPPAVTLATAALLLLHVPPGVALVQVVLSPIHIDVDPPVIAPGVTFTVTSLTAVHVPKV